MRKQSVFVYYEYMNKLSGSTKAKLLMPVAYLIITITYFALSFPERLESNHIMGILIALTSFALWLLARVQLGNAFSLAPKSKFVVKNGLYSKLRHPVYYFSITALIGVSLFSASLWMLLPLTILCIVEAVRINKEEKILADAFGADYTEYKKLTWF